jgi:GAF domain-containing protein
MCKNMRTDPRFGPWREHALKRGYESSIVFPLKSNERTFGAVTIYSKHPNPFKTDEIRLLTKLTNDLAQGILSIRLRKAKQIAEQALKNI